MRASTELLIGVDEACENVSTALAPPGTSATSFGRCSRAIGVEAFFRRAEREQGRILLTSTADAFQMLLTPSPSEVSSSAARILVVEDDVLNGFLIEETLQLAGHKVLGPAKTVPGALALLESCAVDAAILDLQIEDETSLAVARRLDDLGIPWAMTTGHSRSVIPPEYDHVRLLTKPFSIAELLEVTANTLVDRE
jgi:CheY-like chemotaxis protein